MRKLGFALYAHYVAQAGKELGLVHPGVLFQPTDSRIQAQMPLGGLLVV